MMLRKTVNQEPEHTKNRWKSWEQIKKGRLWEDAWEWTFSTFCCSSVTI